MAELKFEFPTTSSPTTTLEFPKGGFKGDIPTGVRTFNQSTDKSQAGEIQTMSHGNNPREFTMSAWVAIANQGGNTADITKIATFINSTINGSLKFFYYTPRGGATACKVKLMNPNSILQEELVNYHVMRFEMTEDVNA